MIVGNLLVVCRWWFVFLFCFLCIFVLIVNIDVFLYIKFVIGDLVIGGLFVL